MVMLQFGFRSSMDLNNRRNMLQPNVDKEVLFAGMSAPQSKTLYQTPQFSVKLHQLPAGASLALPAVSAANRQLIATKPNLQLSIGTASHQPHAGDTVLVSKGEPVSVNNQGNESIALLEVQTGGQIEGSQNMALPPVTETRPWGSFTVLADEPDFKLKQLMVKPGNRLSYQRHQKREEHWFVIAGKPEVVLNGDQTGYTAGDYVNIPLHAWHRLINAKENTEPVEIIELQLGTYFGEDDIERQDDDYGRQ